MNQFPSTLLPQNSSPQEMQKAHFDMLSKVNQTRTDAQAAAAAAQAASVPLNNPVAGETSLGTEHVKTGTQSTWFVAAASPGAGVWLTVTFSVTTGTKAVVVAVELNGAVADYLRWRPYNNGDTWANSIHRTLIGWNSAAVAHANSCQVTIPVDSAGRVDLAINSAGGNFQVGYPQLYLI